MLASISVRVGEKIIEYKNDINKANLCNWQLFHHHGSEGIKRAERLQYWFNLEREEIKDKFIINYINSKNNVYTMSIELQRIANYCKCKPDPLYIDKEVIDQDAKLLSGGNDTRSSLRTYIRTALDLARNDQTQIRYQRTSVSSSISSMNMSLRTNSYSSISSTESFTLISDNDMDMDSDLNQNFTNNNATLKKFIFANSSDTPLIIESKNLGECKKTSNTSAHTVKIFNNNNQYYFVKYFKPLNNKEIEDGLAEVVYAKIWRYLIGDRASDSKLVIDSNNHQIIGICSVGLNRFREYDLMDINDKLMTKGLISLLICVYILAENDFHIYNFGQMSYDGKLYYGKIDHDYIVAHWTDMKRELNSLDVMSLANAIKNKNTQKIIDLLKGLRFSPVIENRLYLQYLHSLRSKFSERKVTTTSQEHTKDFKEYINNKGVAIELEDITKTIGVCCSTVEMVFKKDMTSKIREFSSCRKELDLSKTYEILNCMTDRMKLFGHQLNSK